jgi:hypothetical protein
MFHIYAMGNIVTGVEFVIKTLTFFYPYEWEWFLKKNLIYKSIYL